MTKKSFLMFVFMALLSPLLASASIDANLKYGMRNNEVSELQDFLVEKGFLHTSPTGFFGLLTLNAVKSFQSSVDLPSTGYVGSMTRGVVNSELASAVASSTEAEIAETGTSTPIQNTYHYPVSPVTVQSPVVGSVPSTTTAPPALAPIISLTPTVSFVNENPRCELSTDWYSGRHIVDIPISISNYESGAIGEIYTANGNDHFTNSAVYKNSSTTLYASAFDNSGTTTVSLRFNGKNSTEFNYSGDYFVGNNCQ